MSVVAGIGIDHPAGYLARLRCSDCGQLESELVQPTPKAAYRQAVKWLQSHRRTHDAVAMLLTQIERRQAI